MRFMPTRIDSTYLLNFPSDFPIVKSYGDVLWINWLNHVTIGCQVRITQPLFTKDAKSIYNAMALNALPFTTCSSVTFCLHVNSIDGHSFATYHALMHCYLSYCVWIAFIIPFLHTTLRGCACWYTSPSYFHRPCILLPSMSSGNNWWRRRSR